MGSRRSPTGSPSWNGRNGDNGSGGSRPGVCSYLSNVRPGNRSTFCSVMAQLTEETQPSFETTLKSKAVSENCNVKFSCVVTGHPIPQLTWYKDDMQLDRYCGLPKYELFRNGQNHSLHIYNCTVEDAAIYQASAINSKGIVSCSGVLEVGEMNEFKIHERYFAKLKQKAERRRREAEGKENQELLRTISPDRTQRKRRSTMEAFLSTPSSMEDEGSEENHQAVAVETEARLQEKATVEEAEEKPQVSNGQVTNENGTKDGTYKYDAAQKSFTAHKPKTPFAKKKIKISNGVKLGKADTLGERPSEEGRAKDETSASVAPLCKESAQSKGNSGEVMEVEKIMSSDDRRVTGRRQKSATAKESLVEGPSQGERIRHVPSKTEQLTDARSPAADRTPEGQSVSGTEGGHVAKHENEAGHKGTKENARPDLNLSVPSTQLRPSVASTTRGLRKEVVVKTEDATAMDIDEKSDTSTTGSLAHRDLKAEDPPCERRAAPPEPPCGRAADEPSEKETSRCQKRVSEARPPLLSEVTRTCTKNDAPVNIELPPARCTMDGAQPTQRTPSERGIVGADIQTPSLHRGLQAATGKMTLDVRDHSRGSNESHAVLLTDLKESPLESPGAGETTRERNADTAVKTVEGTEIHVDEKVNTVGKLIIQADSGAPSGKIVEMETETAALDLVEKTTGVDKDADVVVVEASCEEKNEPLVKMAELQDLKSEVSETATPHLTNSPDNVTLEQMIGLDKTPKPGSKVVSVAELLRSQIKALDLTFENSVQEPTTTTTTTTEESQGLRLNDRKCKVEVKKTTPDTKTETIVNDNPPENIKTMLMEVYHQLNLTSPEQIQTQSKTASPALQNPSVVKTTGHNGSAKTYKEADTSTGQETGALHRSTRTDCPVVTLTDSQNGKHKILPSIAKDEPANRSVAVSRGAETPTKATTQESNDTVLEHVQDERVKDKDVRMIKTLTPEIKLNGNTERGMTEVNPTTVLDQCKVEEHDTNTSSLPSAQTFPVSQIVLSTDTQPLQLDGSMGEGFPRSDSLTSANPEASPLLKQRDCVSPLSSATPQELASGARRKIMSAKSKAEEATEATSPVESQVQKKEASTQSGKLSASCPATPSASPSLSRRSPPLQSPGERVPPVERCSPLLSRRKTPLEADAPSQQPAEKIHNLKTEGKPPEKDKHDPFKAPQVIRKIRGESFADASGHLKLWCQFFNVLSDSTVKWFKNEEEIARIKRNAGDETQVNLAIVQASRRDFGVYGCSITNEYGTDSTDTLLSAEILAGMSLREDLSVGEEIEMTPLLFNKGVADSGIWGSKLFGRIMMRESHIGDGCSHKVWRAKVIYGLEPVFESGNTCVIKVRNPIAYGGKEESGLIERNLDIIKQECRIQNLAREYCKIFSAEARVIESFGPSLEVIPVHLMYRPANSVPYATVEADLTGVYQKYSVLDHTGRMDVKTGSAAEQKCCALQHWIFQWTSGNLLLSRLEGVDTKITNVGISVKSTGHQGLSIEGNPKVFEQFVSQHQCNYFCGLLGLRSLKVMDSLFTPTKPKGSRSPLLQRKMAAGSSSPQTGRKAAGSPRLPRKAEQEGRQTPTGQKAADAPEVVKMA